MQYMLLIYDDESRFASLSKDALKQMHADYGTFTQELIAAGALEGGSELSPIATATTVRVRNGKVQTTDGPFAETKEQLGGYYIINVDNLDQAIQWAEKIPSANGGSIEVRPLVKDQPQ
jgi:hypothetical protein